VNTDPVGVTNRLVTPLSSILAAGAAGSGTAAAPRTAVARAPGPRANVLTIVIALLAAVHRSLTLD
jgi:hypothetical protein